MRMNISAAVMDPGICPTSSKIGLKLNRRPGPTA
jgi:hypothetical protein